MAKGCPLAYTRTSAIPGYSANANVGRRKRQANECASVARLYASNLREYSDTPAGQSFSEEVINRICRNTSVKGFAEHLKSDLENIVQAFKIYKEKFGVKG